MDKPILVAALKKVVLSSIDLIEKNLKEAIPEILNELIEMVANDYLPDIEDEELEKLTEGYKDIEDLDLDDDQDDILYVGEKYLHKSVFPIAIDRLKENLQWEDNKIKVWRKVVLQDLDELDTQSLGEHWSYSKDYAEAYDYSGDDGDEYIIEARAPVDSIDYPLFLNRLISHWGETEREIAIKKGKFLYDIQVTKDGSTVQEYEKLKA